MIDNHLTATGIVFNSKKEILMIHHNKLYVWLPPGGHVDKNELPDDAVLREVYEDLVPQDNEVHGIGWFTFEQIKELKTFDNVIKTISQAIDCENANSVVQET